jgi:hypothetical protein
MLGYNLCVYNACLEVYKTMYDWDADAEGSLPIHSNRDMVSSVFGYNVHSCSFSLFTKHLLRTATNNSR